MSPSRRLATYVINLDTSPNRLDAMQAQFAALKQSFTRISAVDGRGFGPEDVPRYDEAAALRYMGRKVLGGELGCFLSHIRAAEAILADGCAAALVFEDDAVLNADTYPVVHAALDWLDRSPDRDWRLINLGYPAARLHSPLTMLSGPEHDFALCRAHYFPMGAFALCWSRRGAEEFLKRSATIFSPVDNLLRHWLSRSGGGLGFRPGLVGVVPGNSDIDDDLARTAHGRRPSYGWKKQRRLWSDKAWALRGRITAGRG